MNTDRSAVIVLLLRCFLGFALFVPLGIDKLTAFPGSAAGLVESSPGDDPRRRASETFAVLVFVHVAVCRDARWAGAFGGLADTPRVYRDGFPAGGAELRHHPGVAGSEPRPTTWSFWPLASGATSSPMTTATGSAPGCGRKVEVTWTASSQHSRPSSASTQVPP